MSPTSNVRSVKLMVEKLEDRTQPSFLLAGTVQAQLLPPLQAIYTDMQNAKTDLQTQFTTLHNGSTLGNIASAEVAFGQGSADYQRILSDQHAIAAIVNADVNFIRAAAFAELSEGDSVDALIVVFGSLFNINPTSVLTNVQTQANNLVNGSDVQTWVTTDFYPTSGLYTHNTFADEVTTPSF